jgi:GntR family transcriptional regulator, transcriptional repressor for pyruvate dehydrogenase complex
VNVSTAPAHVGGGDAGAGRKADEAAGSASADRHLDAFRPITLQKAADAVVAVLVDAIRGGLFEPGDLLPSERQLATRLQVSRNVVRDGIDVLRREGVVSVKRGVGGGIRVIAVDRLHDVVAGLRGKTHDLMQTALEARRAIEFPSFLLAAERATDTEMDALAALVDGLPELADAPEAFYALDQRFHRDVVRLSGNALLCDFYRATLVHLAEIRREFPVLQVPYEEAVHNQRVLYSALRTRAPATIEAMLDAHLAATEVVYLGEPLGSMRGTTERAGRVG